MFRIFALAALLLLAFNSSPAAAQYVGITNPFHSYTDSYYQRVGVNFGFDFPARGNVVGLNPDGSFTQDGRIRFSQGGFGSAVPQFGGYDPGADAHIGFRIGGGNKPGFNFNLVAGQGSSRTGSMVAPSIVVPNGVPGGIFDGQLRPFVTGIVPVVGYMPSHYYIQPAPTHYVNPIAYKLWQLDQQAAMGQIPHAGQSGDGLSLEDEEDRPSVPRGSVTYSDSNSSATQAARSVADIRRERTAQASRQERERRQKIDELLAAADDAVTKGLLGSARYNLQRALRLAEQDEVAEIEAKLEALDH